MKNVFRFIISVALLILAGWTIHERFFLTEEGKVFRVIVKGCRSFESGSVLPFHGILSVQYHDHQGLDKAMVLRALAEFYQSTDKRSVQLLQRRVVVNQNKAYVDLTVLLRMHATKSVNFTRLDLRSNRPNELLVSIELDKVDNRWRIVNTDVKLSDRISFRY